LRQDIKYVDSEREKEIEREREKGREREGGREREEKVFRKEISGCVSFTKYIVLYNIPLDWVKMRKRERERGRERERIF
jgi:hypothetical protein